MAKMKDNDLQNTKITELRTISQKESLKKWWVESDFKAPNLPLSLRSKVPAVTIAVFKYRNKIGKIVVKAVPYSVT
jgi:hypothetical protein